MFQGDAEHPICPVMLGDAKLAAQFADKMLGAFLTCPAFKHWCIILFSGQICLLSAKVSGGRNIPNT